MSNTTNPLKGDEIVRIENCIEEYLSGIEIGNSPYPNELMYGYCSNGRYELSTINPKDIAEHIVKSTTSKQSNADSTKGYEKKLGCLIKAGRGFLFPLSERKIIFEAMETYLKQSNTDCSVDGSEAVDFAEWIYYGGWIPAPVEFRKWYKWERGIIIRKTTAELYDIFKSTLPNTEQLKP